jgi:hypothetical protein
VNVAVCQATENYPFPANLSQWQAYAKLLNRKSDIAGLAPSLSEELQAVVGDITAEANGANVGVEQIQILNDLGQVFMTCESYGVEPSRSSTVAS